MSLEEIRGRLPILPPLKAEHVASDEDGWLYASITHDHALRDGTVCNQHLATVDSDEEDAEFIAHAPTDVARLLAAVEGVLDLHQPEQCTNDDGFLIDLYTCSECKTSEDGGLVPVLDPCPTVKAITAALEGTR